MPRRIVVKGEGTWEFPDDATDGEIAIAINQKQGLGPGGRPEFPGKGPGYEPKTSGPGVLEALDPGPIGPAPGMGEADFTSEAAPAAPSVRTPLVSSAGAAAPSLPARPPGALSIGPGPAAPVGVFSPRPLAEGAPADIAWPRQRLDDAQAPPAPSRPPGPTQLFDSVPGAPYSPYAQSLREGGSLIPAKGFVGPGLDAALGDSAAGQAGAFATRTGASLVEGLTSPLAVGAAGSAAVAPEAAALAGAAFTMKMGFDLLTKALPKLVGDLVGGDTESAKKESGPDAMATLLATGLGAKGTKSTLAGAKPIIESLPAKVRGVFEANANRAATRPIVEEMLAGGQEASPSPAPSSPTSGIAKIADDYFTRTNGGSATDFANQQGIGAGVAESLRAEWLKRNPTAAPPEPVAHTNAQLEKMGFRDIDSLPHEGFRETPDLLRRAVEQAHAFPDWSPDAFADLVGASRRYGPELLEWAKKQDPTKIGKAGAEPAATPVAPAAPPRAPGGAPAAPAPPAEPVAPVAPEAPQADPAAPAVATEAAGKPTTTIELPPPGEPPAPPSTLDTIIGNGKPTPLEQILANDAGKTKYPLSATDKLKSPFTVTGPPVDQGKKKGLRVPVTFPDGRTGMMPIGSVMVPPQAAPAPEAPATTEAVTSPAAPVSQEAAPEPPPVPQGTPQEAPAPVDDRRWDTGAASHVDALLGKRRAGTATREDLESLVDLLGERADSATREAMTHYSGVPGKKAWLSAKEEKKHQGFVATDIAQFKWLNDTHGQTVGDAVITQAAKIVHGLAQERGGSGYVTGGDEYVSGLPAGVDLDEYQTELAKRMKSARVRVTNPDGSVVTYEGIPVKMLGGTDADAVENGLKSKGRAAAEPWRVLAEAPEGGEGGDPLPVSGPEGPRGGAPASGGEPGGEPDAAGPVPDEPAQVASKYPSSSVDPEAGAAFHFARRKKGEPAPAPVPHGERVAVRMGKGSVEVEPIRAWVGSNAEKDGTVGDKVGFRRVGGWRVAPGLAVTEAIGGSEKVFSVTHLPSGLALYHGSAQAALEVATKAAALGDWDVPASTLLHDAPGEDPRASLRYRVLEMVNAYNQSDESSRADKRSGSSKERPPRIYDPNAIYLPPEKPAKGKTKGGAKVESPAPAPAPKDAPSSDPVVEKIIKLRDAIIGYMAEPGTYDRTLPTKDRSPAPRYATAAHLAEMLRLKTDLKVHTDYSSGDLYDAIELAINKLAANDRRFKGNRQTLRELIEALPTKTVRDTETDRFQQFSTPADYSAVVAKLAGIGPDDVVLEPTVGLGSLAAAAVARGARVIGNELEPGRAALVKQAGIGLDAVYTENAEIINAALAKQLSGPDQPTVVLMNPPFSAAVGVNTKAILTGARHIEAAFRTLAPGGRLVAIVGAGMHRNAKKYAPAFEKLSAAGGTLVADLDLTEARSIYAKYGTTFPTRVLIWDKVKDGRPDAREFKVKSLAALEDFRDRIAPRATIEKEAPDEGARPGEQRSPESGGEGEAATGGDSETGIPVRPPADDLGEGAGRGSAAADPDVEGRSGPDAGDAPGGGELPGVEVAGRPEPVAPGRRKAPGARPGTAPANEPAGSGSESAPSVLGEADRGDERGVGPDSRRLTVEMTAEDEEKGLTEAVFESYTPVIRVSGAKSHPALVVESSAMAVVRYPPTKYVPDLPAGIIESGALSDVQLEAVVLAGASHEQVLPSGERRGFLVGDGTGVGKARTLAGIIADNRRRGRKKAVWVTENWRVAKDMITEAAALGIPASDFISLEDVKLGAEIPSGDKILLATYTTLRPKKAVGTQEEVGKKSRLEQVTAWMGADFDGVIAYDEAHNMANAMSAKDAQAMAKGARGQEKPPSAQALAGIALAKAVPKARVVYASATAATEVANLAYADRLGLWGEETSFATKAAFIAEISRGGIAAMELVAQGMKAAGLYCARTLSYEGVDVTRLQHTLTDQQKEIWGELAGAWRMVFSRLDEALGFTSTDHSGNVDTKAKSAARSAFWGANQRFWNQILTSMQMPSVLADIDKQLKAGHAAVIQLTSTLASQLDRELKGMKDDEDLERLDLTPRQGLLGYVERSFPVFQMTQTTDDDGNVSMNVARDSDGKPILNPDAVALRDELLTKLASVRVPDGVLEQLLDKYGPEVVAEVTGRGQRVYRKKDGTAVHEKRGAGANAAEIAAFMDGRKSILVFSDAGGTGASYHADRRRKNQKRRCHYLVQPGWRADKAIQGLGRSHRANQANTPIFTLVSTEVPGHKRFVSTIARRLAQAGALTKGQRSAAGQGMFSEMDNLESPMARESMHQLLEDIHGNRVSGMNTVEFESATGLTITTDQGNLRESLPPMPQILNRLLSMPLEDQNLIFDEFGARLERRIVHAKETGKYDLGVEDVTADEVIKKRSAVVFTDPRSGAETKYHELLLRKTRTPEEFPDRRVERYVKNIASGRVHAIDEGRMTSTEKETGRVVTKLWARTPYGVSSHETDHYLRWGNTLDTEKWADVSKSEAKKLWEEQSADVPKFSERTMHLITGALLSIWDRLGFWVAIRRVKVTDGPRLLGRLIDDDQIEDVLQKLGVAPSEGLEATVDSIMEKVADGKWRARLANGGYLKRSLVTGTYRLEIDPGRGATFDHRVLQSMGVAIERHSYAVRYFFPPGEATRPALERFLKTFPATSLLPPKGAKAMQDSRSDSKAPGTGRNTGEFAQAVREAKGIPPRVRTPRTLPPLPPAQSEFRAFLTEFRLDIQRALAPQTVNGMATVAGDSMRENTARADYRMQRANAILGPARKALDRLKEDDVVAFLNNIETGAEQETPELQKASDLLREILDEARDVVRSLGTGRLKSFIEDYFPHLWENKWQAEDWAATFTKQRNWQGNKSFLKKRHIEFITDGLAAGLKLKHPNPVDAVMEHLHQVYKYVSCQSFLAEGRHHGYVKAFSAEATPTPPPGWEKLDPRVGTIYGRNKVKLEEIVDEKLYEAAQKVIADLAATHKRLAGTGRTAGTFVPEDNLILTRFASPMGVLWHEIGHLLEEKFHLWREVAGKNTAVDPVIKAELEALADLRVDGVAQVSKSYRKYLHTRDEMIANLLDAFVTSRETFRKTAPKAFTKLEEFLRKHAETRPILDLRPSLVRKTLSNEQKLDGILVKGYWAAPKEVARIINRQLSPGLGHNKTYKGFRWVFNLVNQAQLGLSGFHWAFTNLDAMISRGALGFYELAQGDVAEGSWNVLNGLSPLTPFQNVYRGHQIMKAAMGETAASIPDVGRVVTAGGRFKQESIYHTEACKKLSRALKQGDILKFAGNLLPAFFELTSKPLMEWWVPRQKLGVFALLAQYEVKRLGEDADPVAVRHALARAWDSVDNRMGQLVYDNLFWNRTAKDCLMLAVRSLGWNIGDLRELGGGLYDLAMIGRRIGSPRGGGSGRDGSGGPDDPGNTGRPAAVDLRDPAMTHRMAYGLYMAFGVAVIGAMINYLLTGRGPRELRDYYFPRTGAKNTDGSDERLSLPSYVKDCVAYKEHPLTTVGHKLHPALWEAYYMGRNADFFNVQIHNPEDPFFKRRLDDAKHVAGVLLPFSLREVVSAPRNPGTKIPKFAPALGITRAPAYVTETPLTAAMKEFFGDRALHGAKTQEMADRMDYIGRADDRLRAAKTPEERRVIQAEIRQMQKDGKLKPTDSSRISKAADQTPLASAFAKPMPIMKALDFWDLADEDERAQIRPLLKDKAFGKMDSRGSYRAPSWQRNSTREELKEIRARIQKALGGKK